MDNLNKQDKYARHQGRNPAHSFLVEAPAGSGKTELLIQRVLALLAIVTQPEEILALTFTRKAAGEMHSRVMDALTLATQPVSERQPEHVQVTRDLAIAALARSKKLAWHLIEYPSRLRIMTIDAFAASMARQLPLLSSFGASPVTSEHANRLYRESVERMFKEEGGEIGLACDALLLHLDHRRENVIELLCQMLACRDQWLGDIVAHDGDMPKLRQNLANHMMLLIKKRLTMLAGHLPDDLLHQLPPLAAFAAENLECGGGRNPLLAAKEIASWPQAVVEALPQWKALANLLLTADLRKASWRKSISKSIGFPADKDLRSQKEHMLEILSNLQGHDALLQALNGVRFLPDQSDCHDEAWTLMQQLFTVLKHAAAHLWITFQRHGEVDFTEVALRALKALGAVENPESLLLRLDCRIKHMLLDEFQDTSGLQIQLVERLMSGWQPGDEGRTLFLVGDPMQSIYGFRKADVGLFMKATQHCLLDWQYNVLSLTKNFRSSPAIVTWANRAFAHIFPTDEDVMAGAVSYRPSIAAKDTAGLVSLHLMHERDDCLEAENITSLLKTSIARGKNCALLARSRAHLYPLMHMLIAENIPFRAVELLPLTKSPVVRDLRALTRALLHLGDRESWAALLRSPCCQLDLQDLHTLLMNKDGQTHAVWSLLTDTEACNTLSEDGKHRIAHLVEVISEHLCLVGRIQLRRVIESCWLGLGFPALIDAQDMESAKMYFALIDTVQQAGGLDFTLFDERLERLYAASDNKNTSVQIELMTMHAAKGLQWDVVILPGLGKRPKRDQKSLLAWAELSLETEGEQQGLLMAPLPQVGSQDALYDMVRQLKQDKRNFETARLLYVACTRAESQLHLFGHLEEKSGEWLPATGSLLDLLWESEQHCFGAEVELLQTGLHHEEPREIEPRMRWELKKDWQLPIPAASIQPKIMITPLPVTSELIEFDWAGVSARAVGIALHALLQRIGEKGIEHWETSDRQHVTTFLRRSLISEGLAGEWLSMAMQRAEQGVEHIYRSDRAAWLLSSRHQDAHCEWPLSCLVDGEVRRYVLDRSFIDADGIRWIVDYKTGLHTGSGLDQFLDQEQERYTAQLQSYAAAVSGLEERVIRMGLYFPLVDGWRHL
ncbi:MAG: UvrD-helicase domain-containing protein [Mariprofundaceae bacterium]